MTDESLPETDGKSQRVTVTDGSLTDMHGSGGQWSRRRWASVVLGPVSWYAAVQVCRCASVLVIAVVYQ